MITLINNSGLLIDNVVAFIFDPSLLHDFSWNIQGMLLFTGSTANLLHDTHVYLHAETHFILYHKIQQTMTFCSHFMPVI